MMWTANLVNLLQGAFQDLIPTQVSGFWCWAKFEGIWQCWPSGIERGVKTPTLKISALLRKQPVLLRANFILTKDQKRPYYGHLCGKIHREGSCSKAAGGP